MFLFGRTGMFGGRRRRISAVAVLLSAALLLSVATMPSAADDTSPPVGWTSALSGAVCHPAAYVATAAPPAGLSANAALLMEARSGEIVFAKNPDTPLPMASTTKIMTALVALEQIPLETVVTIPAEAVGIEGSSVYLTEGERLTVEELLYALLLASANDAAVALAVTVGGSVEGFAEMMNRKAVELGLTSTHFVNPHGLDAEGHHTTARELAIIARAALENPHFLEICSTRRKAIPQDGVEKGRWLLNHNKLLSSYPGCIGVKTGYTKKTGRCLVSAARRDGVTLIAVTLGAPDDWRDHTAMLDYGFACYHEVTLCEEGFFSAPLPVAAGEREYVMVENTDALTVTLPKTHGSIRCVVELPRFAFAPIRDGQTVGRLIFYEEIAEGGLRPLGEVPLSAVFGSEAVVYRRGILGAIKDLFT